jgi:hypothetical protein
MHAASQAESAWYDGKGLEQAYKNLKARKDDDDTEDKFDPKLKTVLLVRL